MEKSTRVMIKQREKYNRKSCIKGKWKKEKGRKRDFKRDGTESRTAKPPHKSFASDAYLTVTTGLVSCSTRKRMRIVAVVGLQ